MLEPVISVIVPVYNVEKYIQKCMDTLLTQDYTNLEILLIDDGSTDSSGHLCDEFAKNDDRIVVYHKKNEGLAATRNYGIARAKGEYLTFIDSDDFIDQDYVSYLWKLLSENDVKMSICQHRVLTSGKKTIEYGSFKVSEVIDAETCIKRMLYHDVIDTTACAKLYHRSIFEGVSYPAGRYYEDIGTTYLTMMKCDRIAIGYESKYNYIYRAESIVNSKFKPAKLDLLEMTDKMAGDVVNAYPQLSDAANRRCVYARFSTLNQMFYVDTKEFKEKRSEIIRYIKAHYKDVKSDPLTPRRDIYAINALKMGFPVYKFFWKIYLKAVKG